MSKPRDLHWLKDIEREIEKIENHPKYSGGHFAVSGKLNTDSVCTVRTMRP